MVARSRLLALPVVVLLLGPAAGSAADKFGPFVAPGPGGRLTYEADARGNRVPDFSHCGYLGGGVAIPDAPVRVRVPARPGDATARIQAAIDYVAQLPAGGQGLRGVVLIEAGR